MTALAVNGQPVVVTTATINVPLILATLRVSQKIVGPTEVTQRALVVDTLFGPDVVVAEARAGYNGSDAHPNGHPCTV